MGEERPSPELGETVLDQERSSPVTVDAALVRQGLLSRGVSIGRYVVVDNIGSGAMGVVYGAYDPDLDRKLAIKLLVGVGRPTTDESAGRTRLVREAQAMAKLAHPNVVTVHDVGVFYDQVYVVMEYVDGSTLGTWLTDAKRSMDETLDVFAQAGRGLAAAHAAGLVHRDFKPDNVLIGKDGRVRVGDFGIAQLRDVRGRVLDDGDGRGPALDVDELRAMIDTGRFADIDTSGQLTEIGARIGTPAYMAPEQHLGKAVDARADQFAFCVALWEALYGERPFAAGESVLVLSYNVCSGNLRAPPAHVDVPVSIRRALERGLSVDPDERFEHMGVLLQALEPTPHRARRLGFAAAAALVLAAVGLGVAVGGREDPLAACESLARDDASFGDTEARRVQERFAGSGSPLAEQSANRVIEGLDAYQSSWVAAWNDACRATHVDAAQSVEMLALRQRCLERRRDALDALVEVLTEPSDEGAALVEGSVEAVAALPRFDHCADPDALVSDIAPPPPPLAASVDEARREIERVRALMLAGQVHEASRAAEASLAAATEVDYPPLHVEAQLALGEAKARASDLDGGRTHLEAAATMAIAIGYERRLGEASNALMEVVGERQSNYDAGFVWARVAEGLALKWPGTEHEAEYRRGHCITMADTGRVDEAWSDCERAIELATALFGEDHPRTAAALRAHGKALFVAGRGEDGLPQFRRALAIQIGAFGEGHPKVIGARNAVAVGLYSAGDVEGATKMLREVVSSYEATMGVDHELTAINRNNLAQMELELGHVEAAAKLANTSLRGLIEGFGEAGHPGIGAALMVLAQTNESDGDLEQARERYEQAHEVFTKTRGGPSHPNVIDSATSLAKVLVRTGRANEAESLAREAVAGAADLDPTHPRNVAPRLALVAALRAVGKDEEARLAADALRELVRRHDIEIDPSEREAFAVLPRSDEPAHGTVLAERHEP